MELFIYDWIRSTYIKCAKSLGFIEVFVIFIKHSPNTPHAIFYLNDFFMSIDADSKSKSEKRKKVQLLLPKIIETKTRRK